MKQRRASGSPDSSLSTPTVLLIFLAGACGPGNTSRAPADDAFVALAADLRIDGHAAEPVPSTWLRVSPHGLIAVTQTQDGAIRFFDADGKDLGTVGRQGAGPGEFRRPVRGGWLGDTLWISDVDLNRVTLISPDLRVLRTSPPLVAAGPRPGDRERLPTFTFVFPYALYRNGAVLAGAMGSAGDPLAEAFKGLALEYPFTGVPIPENATDSAIAENERRITQPAARRVFENDGKPRIAPVRAPVASISSPRTTASGSASERSAPAIRGSCSTRRARRFRE